MSWIVKVADARKVVIGSDALRCTIRPNVSLLSATVSLVIDTVTVAEVCPEAKLTPWLLSPT